MTVVNRGRITGTWRIVFLDFHSPRPLTNILPLATSATTSLYVGGWAEGNELRKVLSWRSTARPFGKDSRGFVYDDGGKKSILVLTRCISSKKKNYGTSHAMVL